MHPFNAWIYHIFIKTRLRALQIKSSEPYVKYNHVKVNKYQDTQTYALELDMICTLKNIVEKSSLFFALCLTREK